MCGIAILEPAARNFTAHVDFKTHWLAIGVERGQRVGLSVKPNAHSAIGLYLCEPCYAGVIVSGSVANCRSIVLGSG